MKKTLMNRNKLNAKLMVSMILLALIANISVGSLAFAQTATPVSGAFVSASGNNGFGSASSDSQGFYNITSFFDTGNYTVEASATGFLDISIENVHVNVGLETSNVDLFMPVSGGISGRITDAVSGAPLQFVFVEAVNNTGSGSSAFTDANGNYTIITNLATGTYNVTTLSHPGHLTKTTVGVSVTAGVMTNNVNLALDKSATISGTVTDSVTAAVLSGITIMAATPDGNFVTSATTNSSGQYTLNTDLGTGTYNVSAILPANHMPEMNQVAVVAGNQYTNNFALDQSGIISGRITSTITGLPLAGALVTASGDEFSGFALTNETGYYRMTDGLGTASYTIFASYGGGFNLMQGVSVTQGAETSNVNLQITLASSGTITGRVTNATGNPIPFASVSAIGTNGLGTATTDSDGNYVIDAGLGTGTYNVTVSETGFATQTQTGVSVTVNQVTANINFQMQAIVSGRISGRVQTLSTPIPEFSYEPLMVGIFAAVSFAVMIKKLKTPKLKPTTPL